MIEFVDISGMEVGKNFSFWSSQNKKFLEFSGNNAWDSWCDFAEDFIKNRKRGLVSDVKTEVELKKFKDCTPLWAFKPIKSYELKEFIIKCRNDPSLINWLVSAHKVKDAIDRYIDDHCGALLSCLIKSDSAIEFCLIFDIEENGFFIDKFEVDLKTAFNAAHKKYCE